MGAIETIFIAKSVRFTRRRAGFGQRITLEFGAWIKLLNAIIDRPRSRRALRELGDEHLRDIGITRAEARYEGDRWFFESGSIL